MSPVIESEPLTAELKPADRLAVDLAGVAELLDCSIRHARNLDTSGRLPEAVKLGKSKRWPVDELREWLAAGSPPRERWEQMKDARA